MIEDLKQLSDLLKAHYEFYEHEQPQDLTLTLSYEQVHRLQVHLSIILRGVENDR